MLRGKQETQREAGGGDDLGSIKRSAPPFIILHYSPFKAVWDSAMQILILYIALVTPYMTTFHLYEENTRMVEDQNAHTRRKPPELLTAACPSVIVDIFVDIVFVVDIIITFRTTFMSSGEIITDPRLIATHYMKSWFFLDALAAVPFDLLLFGNGTGTGESMMFSRLLKLTRLTRLLRFFTGSSRFSQYGSAVLLFLMSIYALIAHWLACAFYAIAAYEQDELQQRIGWIGLLAEKLQIPVSANETTVSLDTESKYITALYFTITMLASIGFGNVAPNTDAEKIFSIFGMLIGSLLSAAIFGNVSSIMLRVYQGTEEFQEHQTSIKEFIRFHRVPGYLAKRLLEYWQYTWSQTNGIDMSGVLTTFPQCLQADICLHLNGILLTKFPAFQKANQGCLRMLCMRFKTVHIPPNNFLIHRGEQLAAIYFIARGCIEILSDDDIIAILGKDDTFGDKHFLGQLERQLVAADKDSDHEGEQPPRIPQSHSEYYVRALTSCDCNKIDLTDFVEILRLYPEFVRHFRRDFVLSFNLKSGSYVPRALEDMDQDVLRFVHIKMPKLQSRNRTRTSSTRSQSGPRFKMQEVSFGFGDVSTYCDMDMNDFQVYCGDESVGEKQQETEKVIDDFQADGDVSERLARNGALLRETLRVDPPAEFASICSDGQFVTLDEFMCDAFRKVDKLVDNFEQFERKIVADFEEILHLVSLLDK